MNLDPRAVELPLDRDSAAAGGLHCFDDIVRRVGEHRLDGAEELQAIRRQRGERSVSSDTHRARDRAEVSGQHHRAPKLVLVDVRGFRDRVEQHALERALPDFADDERREELLFVRASRARRVRGATHGAAPSSLCPSPAEAR